MIAMKAFNSYDVLAIPESWDCFVYQGWLYRRKTTDGLSSFYREKWVGLTAEVKGA